VHALAYALAHDPIKIDPPRPPVFHHPMSCPICLDEYKGRVKSVACQYCPSTACRGCHQRYLLQSYEDPHCVDCKRGWSPEFLAANFPLSFRNDALRKHRRKILFEREKSLLPAMQVFVEAKKDIAKHRAAYTALNSTFNIVGGVRESYWLTRKGYRDISDLYDSVKRKILILEDDIKNIGETDERKAELTALLEQKRTLRTQKAPLKIKFDKIFVEYTTIRTELEDINRLLQDATRIYNGDQGAQPQRREFIMKCGADDCRGFLSTVYKCGTCDAWTCPDCLVVIGLDKTVAHTCAPDAIESAKTIRAETRPCPKCAARIFKIDGCDQMWCVVEGCNTAFSWNTGHVVTGVVHNPHYYAWLQRQGGGTAPREAGDIPCGGLPGFWQLLQSFRAARITPAETHDLERCHRMLAEFEGRLADYPSRMPQLLNREINIQYLMNEMDENEWKRQMEFAEAKFNRKREIGQILQTLVTAGSDLMNQMANRCSAASNTDLRMAVRMWISDTVVPQLEQLRLYTNQCFKDLAIRNHMAVPQIGTEWEWIPIRAIYRKPKVAAAAAAAAPVQEDELPPLDMPLQEAVA